MVNGRVGGWEALVPQFLARQLTYLNQGGRLCPPQYYEPPTPGFSNLATALLAHRIQQPIPKLENPEILEIVVDPESKGIDMVIWVVEFPREGYKMIVIRCSI